MKKDTDVVKGISINENVNLDGRDRMDYENQQENAENSSFEVDNLQNDIMQGAE